MLAFGVSYRSRTVWWIPAAGVVRDDIRLTVKSGYGNSRRIEDSGETQCRVDTRLLRKYTMELG